MFSFFITLIINPEMYRAATAEIKDWKLAFVVNVKLEERDDGCSRRVILDLECTYMQYLSYKCKSTHSMLSCALLRALVDIQQMPG